MSRSSVDLVIVGAGAAGLAAARTASDLNLSYVVFEAMDRIGGRAHTDTATFGVPWDRGCHWLHSASINPMRELADLYGFEYRQETTPRRVWRGDDWASEEENAALEEQVTVLYERVIEVGQAGRDIPISSIVEPSATGYTSFVRSIHAESGVALDQASTLDAARYRDTEENWPLNAGYGALVAYHSREIPVELATPVQRIDWSGPRVKVSTDRGTVEANAIVITVSTNVLAAGLIEFVPALPEWKVSAAAAVPLGTANKVAFAIDGRHFGVEGLTNVSVPVAGDQTMGFQLRPFGYDLADGYLAGPLGRELEAAGESTMIATVLDALKGVFGNDIARHVTTAACSRWGCEPSILGAYAAANPGQADRRADLAAPIDNRLFFAGEATSPDFYSTCHGAHLTGIAAATTASAFLVPR